MQGFFNFVNRQLCEYQSIFPNTARLMDHILFVNGTGLEVNSTTGMIYDRYNKNQRIDSYPEMNDGEWDTLILRCHAKERGFMEKYVDIMPNYDERLAKSCAAYKRIDVNESQFSEEYMYATLCDMRNDKSLDDLLKSKGEMFIRPYPLSPGFATVYDLNEKTPKWLLHIAKNACMAWVRFLNEELEQNNVWIKPSLRPKSPDQEKANAVLAELWKTLSDSEEDTSWLTDAEEKEEDESDYADFLWTTKHRNELEGQAQRLALLIG